MADIIELSSDSNDTIIVPIKEKAENFYDLSAFEDKGIKSENVNEKLFRKLKRNTLEVFDGDAEGDDLFNQIPDSETSQVNSNINVSDNLLKELFEKYLPSKADSEYNIHKETIIVKNHQDVNKELLKRKISDESDETKSVSKKITKKQMLELERNKRKMELQKKKELIEKEKAMKKALKTIQKSINPDECLKVF